jgi:hypothetical protein
MCCKIRNDPPETEFAVAAFGIGFKPGGLVSTIVLVGHSVMVQVAVVVLIASTALDGCAAIGRRGAPAPPPTSMLAVVSDPPSQSPPGHGGQKS